jgi:hypothetical protein
MAFFKLTVNKYDTVFVGNRNRCYYRGMLVEDGHGIYNTIKYITIHIFNFPKDSFIMVPQMGGFHYSNTQYYRMWSCEPTMIIIAHFS